MADPNRPVTGYPAANANGHPPPPPNSNTSYPYAAPPPPPPNYYNPQQYYPAYQPDPQAVRRAIFLRRVLAIIIAVFIIIGTSFFITWLVLRPRLPEIRVDSLSVSNYNLSGYQLTANFQIGITVRNPNSKIKVDYDQVDAYVYSKDYRLAETSLAPFSQPKKNETSIRASEAAVNTYVDGDLVSDMNGQRSRSGRVNFNVRLLMSLRLKAGAWFSRRRYLKAFCGDLSVGIASNSSNGSLIGGPGQCNVGI
ncbi:OLC1v1004733C1 [Oldenlandia corymbosa var. corymbosa]|uniref:OLC1v1004733C1 n=1 Tax=Oldenlandia corymbosa var. corymbosa TaxID=529605 RepID=A0AAV1DCY5_OLDCO|nr:OLC1v1004733C1 [Oldenlandia corymbosa var. corymbosa]